MSSPDVYSDSPGLETLENFASAEQFNAWMYASIKPYCSGKILEVGSGIGNLSSFLLKPAGAIVLTDINPAYCTKLLDIFDQQPKLEAVRQMDLGDPELQARFPEYNNYFDTIVALNVVEHIENDLLAIDNCRYLLKKGGKLVMLVPAFNSLFNPLDSELGHFRRYNRRSVRILMGDRLRMDRLFFFNAAGIPGWFFAGKIFRNRIIPSYQLKLFNKLVPVFKIADRLLNKTAGLSLIAVSTKQ